MRATLVCFLAIVGCAEEVEPDCAKPVQSWLDADGDGFGTGDPETSCDPGDRATVAGDCDDEDPTVFPGAEEVCNGRDEDCNGELDNGFELKLFYTDADGDGFGAQFPAQLACEKPGDAWVRNADDCDDGDPNVHPDAIEVCNGGVDDDCDGLSDDGDSSLDTTTRTRFWRDADADGYGDRDVWEELCAQRAGLVSNRDDCDDSESDINPGATEVCNLIDDDCDTLVDDDDDSTDPATMSDQFEDVDGDGYGNPGASVRRCWPVQGVSVANDDDCDDTDRFVNPAMTDVCNGGVDDDCDPATDEDVIDGISWIFDGDGDGYGTGAVVVVQCDDPGGPHVPETDPLDCDDANPNINPGVLDPCNDGLDADCSGSDSCATCKDWMAAGTPSGVYTIEPTPGQQFDIFCDMTTDGGGWTLVGSTNNTTFDDAGTPTWYADLTRLVPQSGHSEVWSGLRSVTGPAGDIRFACKLNPSDTFFTVDMSFYDIGWYHEITTGTDTQSCFNESNGAGMDPPPARRNNILGTTLPAGNNWAAGYLEGEDSCSDSGDFTVDFDDRGMDSNQSDGTDWGEDDSSKKCGVSGIAGGAWFIFAREP